MSINVTKTEPTYSWQHPVYSMQVGVLHLRQSKVYTRYYEYAAYADDIEVPAGDYAVCIKKSNGHSWVAIEMPGKVVATSTYGVNVGEETVYHAQPYAYQVEEMARAGEVTLDPAAPRREDGRLAGIGGAWVT